MSNTPPSGLPDYFAMFQSMFAPAANAQQTAAANPFAMLDPSTLVNIRPVFPANNDGGGYGCYWHGIGCVWCIGSSRRSYRHQ